MSIREIYINARHSAASKVKKFSPYFYEDIVYYKDYIRYLRRLKTKPEKYQDRIAKEYKKAMGCEVDFNNPKTYSEKIQFLKLYDDSPMRTELTDKYLVRNWIAEKIGPQYLIPLIGAYDSADEIDFDALPEKYVIKTNHGSGWNIVVKDKNKADVHRMKKLLNRWMKVDFAFWKAYQIHYSGIKPKIIIEEYVADKNDELNDYKFLCFNGECKYFWMDFGRYSNHTRNVYDMDWNLQPWNKGRFTNYKGDVEKPENFDEMVRLVNTLCQGFRHVRVDLYNVDGQIYFGEMTFTSGSGFSYIYPIEQEYEIGKLLNLDGIDID